MSRKRFAVLMSVAAVLCAAGPFQDSARDADLAELKRGYERPVSIPFPEGNPFDPAKAELGRALFFDPILSRSGTQSCSTCHRPDLAWGDGRRRAIGDSGGTMALRSPTLLDVAWTSRLGWDGKFRDLESVAFAAMTAPGNMNLTEPEALARLQASQAYRQSFSAAFGEGPISRSLVERALATYERTLVSGVSPFDRWVAGDDGAIGRAAVRGFTLFNGRAGCASCHNGFSFTDGSFHDIGTGADDDVGRGRLFPTSVKLRHAFKTPTLRDAVRRGPYMHDGSIPTLAAVITHYDRGGVDRPSRSVLIKPLGLSDDEKADLLAFLGTLSSPQ